MPSGSDASVSSAVILAGIRAIHLHESHWVGHPRSLAYYLNPSICHKTMANGINILTSPTNPVRSVTCTPLYKGLNVVAMDTGYRLDRKSHLVQDFFHRCYHQDLIAATRPLDSR